MNKISYKKIKKGNLSQFYRLVKELYPSLRFSAVNRKGMISIRDAGIISFFQKVNKVDIITILLSYIPTALAIKYRGNVIDSNGNNHADYYRRKAKTILESHVGSELDNIGTIITLFYNECFDRDANIKKDIIETHVVAVINTQQEDSDDVEIDEPKGTANFLDYLWLLPKKKRIRLKAGKLIKNISISSLVTITLAPYLMGAPKLVEVINNFLLRAPPHINPIMYNST